jgi:hypothetical protein
MDVRRTLVTIKSMCCLHVTLLEKITQSYFTSFTKGIFRPLSMSPDRSTSGAELDGLCVILYVQHSHHASIKKIRYFCASFYTSSVATLQTFEVVVVCAPTH